MALTKEDLEQIKLLLDPIKQDIHDMKERSKQAAIKRKQEMKSMETRMKEHTEKVVTDRVEKLKAEFK